jgi:hypothetical protein
VELAELIASFPQQVCQATPSSAPPHMRKVHACRSALHVPRGLRCRVPPCSLGL